MTAIELCELVSRTHPEDINPKDSYKLARALKVAIEAMEANNLYISTKRLCNALDEIDSICEGEE